MAKHIALVPAAGSGARFGADVPKQYLPLAGKPMLFHTLRALCRNAAVDAVWVVLSPGDEWWPNYDWSSLGEKLQVVFQGGATRAETVSRGLEAMRMTVASDDWVLVHDAARPCLSQTVLARMFAELDDDPVGGLLAVPVADTVKRSDASLRVAATVPRDGLWQAQTPQMFRYGVLRPLLSGSYAVTDESSAIEAAGMSPRLVRSDARNLKVTFPADLGLAELILAAQETEDGQ